MKKTSLPSMMLLVTSLLAGCGGSQPSSILVMPQQINEPVLSEITASFEQQLEKVNNCDGTNPTYVVGYKTIEAQSATFEVVAGAGGLVTGTPVPEVLQVQLEAKIAASLSKQFGITVEKSHEIFLENPQGKYLEQTITWEVTKVKGLIDVIYNDGIAQVAFNKIANVELHDRRSRELSCDTQAIELTPLFPTPETASSPVAVSTTPPPTKIQPAPTESSSGQSNCDGYDWSTCWQIDNDAQTMTWLGIQNGISDIGQSGEALQKIKQGYVAIVTLDTAMTINICTGSIDGIKPGGACPKIIPISAGTHRIISPGESGGFTIYK